jgi:hypothetical protein
MNGKGSDRRPEDNSKYRDEHERIFGKKHTPSSRDK